ncbi:MAG TPA: TonB-dependent receptor [Caulobacteraceae bacterium]
MRNLLLRGASAITVALAGGLCATQVNAADAAAPVTAADEGGAGSIGELVVTAERREQNIETVPVAVTAFSAQQRALIGIQTLQDLTDFTPGLSYTAIDDRPYIRGVGRNTDNLSTASAVATYYNGVYYGANGAIILQKDDLFIGNIEIDRGPQNTLHGSNSDGGTINYVSQLPTHTFYAEARGSVANYGEYMGEAVVSGPLSDNVRFRLGGMYTDDSGGYFRNLDGPSQGGNVSLGSSGTEHYLEAQLDANFGHFDAWGMISSGDSNANYHTAELVGNIPDNLFLNGVFEPSGFYGLCGLAGVPATPGGAGCAGGPPIVPGSVVTDPVTANNFPGNNPGNVNPRQFIQEFTSTNDQTKDIALAGRLTYHFPSFDVTYIGGYQSFDYELNFTTDADAGVKSYQLAAPAAPGFLCAFDAPGAGYNPAGCTQPLTINPTPSLTYFAEKDAFFSHEINITSSNSSPLQYLAGAYWYHEHYSQPVDAGVEPNQPQLAHPDYLGFTGGGLPTLTPAPLNPSSAYSTSDTTLTYNDYAAFGQLSYKVNDQWKVSGAVRYTDDQKSGYQLWRFVEFDGAIVGPTFSSVNYGANTPALDLTPLAIGSTTTTASPGTGLATLNAATGNYQRSLNASWSAWTGEADVDWTPNSTTLAYFRYSRGYKSGGFSTYTIAPDPETAPEFVDAFEIGGKKTIASVFTLNAAAFYYNYNNDQIPLTVQNSQGLLIPTLYNIPLVHTYGVELEGVWKPIEPLTLSLNYAFLSAKIANAGGCIEDTVDPLAQDPGATTSGCPNNGATADPNVFVQNVKGQTLPEAPRNKIAFNALYTMNFEPGRLALSGTVIWKDTTYDDIFNRPDTLQKPYTLVNLRATWSDARDRYNIILFVNNVFNTLGEDGAAGTLLLPAQAGTPEDIVTAYGLTAPRTYGIELEARFK